MKTAPKRKEKCSEKSKIEYCMSLALSYHKIKKVTLNIA